MRLGRRSKIRYDMFELARSADDARRAAKLANLYHRGQDLAWDGREVLPELIARHGGIRVSPDLREAIGRVFDVILWGELAAWRISAELADRIVELEPKMAATSQAHDEARHFYVMHDYLRALGHEPKPMDRASHALLELVLCERDLANKIVGMQLLVETLALTIFQAVRESRIEPVLADLLRYYEKDEARHVGLGIQYLPRLLGGLRGVGMLRLVAFQLRVTALSLASLKALEPHLRTLRMDPRALMLAGREKQMVALEELRKQMGVDIPRWREAVIRSVNATAFGLFPGSDRSLRAVLREARTGWGADLATDLPLTVLEPPDAPAAA